MPITTEQKILALLAHIAYFLGGIGLIVVPLLIFLLKKDDAFVYHHAKQSLVAQLAMLFFTAIVSLLTFVLVGVLLLPVLAILWIALLITSLIGGWRALQGREYYYPMVQWLVRKFE